MLLLVVSASDIVPLPCSDRNAAGGDLALETDDVFGLDFILVPLFEAVNDDKVPSLSDFALMSFLIFGGVTVVVVASGVVPECLFVGLFNAAK